MRLYTCCPETGCGSFQGDLELLRSYGLDPEVGEDDTGHFFRFRFPPHWSRSDKYDFLAGLRRYPGDPAPAPACIGCGSDRGLGLLRCPYGHAVAACRRCLRAGDCLDCPACELLAN